MSRRGGWGARTLTMLLRGYQRVLSPFFTALGSQCRYEPSCSQYMIDAVQSRGPLRGMGLGVWRILRCNPFTAGGYDPAPAPRQTRQTTEPREGGCFT